MFNIHLGVPEMEELWNMLEKKHQSGSATKAEEKLRRQMGKAMVLLSGKRYAESRKNLLVLRSG